MKKITGFLIALLISSSTIYSQTIDSSLISAYKHHSKIILNEFFMNWEHSFEISSSEIINQNDTVKELFNILNEFYSSFINNKSAIGYSPLSDTTRYFIMADTVVYNYFKLKELPPDIILKDTSLYFIEIKAAGFHPFNKIGNTKILYENEVYKNTLNAFFIPGPGNPESLIEDYCSKVSFLNGYIKISGKGFVDPTALYRYRKLSDPVVEDIYFNESMDIANIYFTVECAYKVAQYSEQNGKWVKLFEKILLIC